MATLFLWVLFALRLIHAGAAPMVSDPRGRPLQTWSYDPAAPDGPGTWGTRFDQCNQPHQSPININFSSSEFLPFPPLMFQHFSEKPTRQTIQNDGHTVQVTLEAEQRAKIAGGGLPDEGVFSFAQYHFHWGSDDSRGSEHTLDTVRFPMELHLMFYNSQYELMGGMREAVQHKDGVAVIALLLVLSETDNPALAPIVKHLANLTESGSAVSLPGLDTRSLAALLPRKIERFFRYTGSLTSPSCDEVVSWTVLNEASTVSRAQLAAFRELEDFSGEKLQDNFRPTQPRHNRVVYRSFL